MEKKESPKIKEPAGKEPLIPSKSRLGDRLFNIVKFVLGICLLPFVYSTTAALIGAMSGVDKNFITYFWAGVIGFVIFHLFVYEPTIIFDKSQKVPETVFRFFTPLVKVAPYVLPVYTIILFIVYLIYAAVVKDTAALKYFVFLFGFSIGLHLVFGAKSLRLKQGDFLKGNYIFGFSLIYIINIVILSFGFNLLFDTFSVVNFLNSSLQISRGIFNAVFTQLFL